MENVPPYQAWTVPDKLLHLRVFHSPSDARLATQDAPNDWF
jgi:hypothetical protein